MILTYRILSTLLYPFLFIFIHYRKIIKKEDPKRYKEKIFVSHYNIVEKGKSKLIWFHAASIGEFKSIIPIISELKENFKNLKFLITTTTLSSGNIAREELKKFDDIEHRYIPYDVPFLINKFLLLWKPDKIFLVDSEIWPNLILGAQQNKIPIALLNGRLTNKSFKRWMLFPKTAKKIFNIFELCICSNEETKRHLEKINKKKIYFNGNIKLVGRIDKKNLKNINENLLSNKRFWFAASTHKEENVFCLRTHQKIKKQYNDILTIIAPRHIERVKEIESLSKKFKLDTQILNKNEKIIKNKDIVIINYFGDLNNYFKYAKSVFMGKSMIKKLKDNSGQNPLEAAKLGCKIYHGPYVYNFEDIYKVLEKNKISNKILNDEELSKNLTLDLASPEKNSNHFSDEINELGEKTLIDTMIIIKNFLNNEYK